MDSAKFPERTWSSHTHTPTNSNSQSNSQSQSQTHSKHNSDSYINHTLPNLPDGAALGTPPTPLNESIDESFVTSNTFPTNISGLSNDTAQAIDGAQITDQLPGGVQGAPFPDEVVPTTFDDNVYQSLCELEVGVIASETTSASLTTVPTVRHPFASRTHQTVHD